MDMDLNKCPECGYVNYNQPKVCPQCGCDLAAHREKIYAEMERLRKEEAAKAAAEQAEKDYRDALALFTEKKYTQAAAAFRALGDYKDAVEYVEKSDDGVYESLVAEFNENKGLALIFQQKKDVSLVCDPSVFQGDVIALGKEKINSLADRFKAIQDVKEASLYLSTCKFAISVIDLAETEKIYKEAVELFNNSSYTLAAKKFKTLDGYKDSAEYLKKCAEEHSVQMAEAERKVNEDRRKKQKATLIERIIMYVVFLLPLVLTIVYAIILFPNSEAIDESSSYVGWTIGWVFFLIASVLIPLFVLSKKKEGEWSVGELKLRVVAGITLAVTIVSMIVVFSGAAKLGATFDPNEQITISAAKIAKEEDDDYYHTYVTFEVENKSDKKIECIWCDVTFYDGEKELHVWEVRFNKTLKAGGTDKTKIDFSETNSSWMYYYEPENEPQTVYSTSTDKLKITYQITMIEFEDYVRKEYEVEPIEMKIA